MRKRLCCIIAALILTVLLPGCGTKDAAADHSPRPTAASTTAPERTSTPESPDVPETPAALEPAAPKSEITQEMAYAGVNNYCHITYDWSIAEEIPDIMYVVNWDETETEYVVMFRSYTGAHELFYVDKASGVTRIVFYEPVQQKETDEGTINIWDYLETGG